MRIVTFAFLVLFMLPAWASEPGQPIDCSDWVPSIPGLSCTAMPGWVAGAGPEQTRVLDNQGLMLWFPRADQPVGYCGVNELRPRLLERYDYESGTRETIGQFLPQCAGTGPDNYGIIDELYCLWSDGPLFSGCQLFFDEEKGRLLIPVQSSCYDEGWTGQCAYNENRWVIAISGFTTTFDILQTYTPASGQLSFRVPHMPEGLQYADWFDTYYGDLATVGDWSQAQPLRCGYPATAPTMGDYLTVDDTLPTPAAGRGYYYVTAANYQGQRRYGRQSNRGVLRGRDPAVLPACSE